MKTIFMNMENSKKNEPHKFVVKLSRKLDLRSTSKHVALQNWFVYYKRKTVTKQYQNKKVEIIAPTWNGDFELLDSSYSVPDIQDYIEYIIKKHKTLTMVPPIHVPINRINNRLVFKIKDGYILEIQTAETMKLFASKRKLSNTIKNEENVPNLEVVELVLVQCNLIDNQCKQKSELLQTFRPNKSYAYLLNVGPGNLVFLKSYSTEFYEIIIAFTDQNDRPLEIKGKVSLTLLINI